MATVKSINGVAAASVKSLNGVAVASIKSVNEVTWPVSVTYTTWNPSDKSAGATLSGGNLTMVSAGGSWIGARSVLGVSSGKWYWEATLTLMSGTDFGIGLSKAAVTIGNPWFFGGSVGDGYAYLGNSGNKRTNTNGDTAYGSTFGANGDIISVAFDLDNGKIWWAKNGTWQASGDPAAGTNAAYTGISGTYYAIISAFEAYTITANFGASAFTYTVPTGFNAGLYS